MPDAASPQLEDGFTQLANELLEAMAKLRCPPSVIGALIAVVRETYGYNEKTAPCPRARVASHMGVSERRARQAVEEAIAWGLLIRDGRKLGVQKDYTRWRKPEGRTSGYEKDKPEGYPSANRKAGPPQKEEPRTSGCDQLFPDVDRRGTLPGKPEARPSQDVKDKKDSTSRSKATTSTPSSADDALGVDALDDRPLSQRKPANTEKAQLVQELWEASGFEGSPPSKKPAAYSGAIRLVDGKFAVARELIAHLKRSPLTPEEGETPGAFFVATLKTMLAAPPGVGWRKAEATWQTEIPQPPPKNDPKRLSFRR